jgi:hypothetical protein
MRNVGAQRGCAPFVLCILLLLPGTPLAAQTTGPASFRVYARGALVGSAHSSVTRDDVGWVLEGTSELDGLHLSVKRLIVRYDARWSPRDMSMELATPDDHMIVHVAFGLAGGSTRTDIVRATEAVFGENHVAADTIPLPDMVFSAYEGLAARLASATPGSELRAFIVARTEITISLDGVRDEAMPMLAGSLATRHWHVRLMRAGGPQPADLWVSGGRLVRLDLPADGLTVVRDDVAWRSGS